MSAFQRLFEYASAPTNRPLENFSTELLAAAISHAPEPLFKALDALCPDVSSLEVETQRRLGDIGIPDLLIHVDGRLAWVIEVKVDAPESSDQLEKYATIKGPTLVYLTRQGQPAGVARGLAWSDVHRAAQGSSDTWWRELVKFMEWHGMANLGDTNEKELASAYDASRLMKRVVRSVRAIVADLRAQGFGSWPADARLEARIVERFLRDGDEAGTMTVEGSNRDRAGLCFGLHPPNLGEPLEARVWIWRDRRYDADDALAKFVRAAMPAVGARWVAAEDPWLVVEAVRADVLTATAMDLERWFGERVAELEKAGVLERLLPKTPLAPPQGDPGEGAG